MGFAVSATLVAGFYAHDAARGGPEYAADSRGPVRGAV